MADPISTPLEDARTRLREATDLLGCDPGHVRDPRERKS